MGKGGIRWPFRLGYTPRGLIIAACLLSLVEGWLHTDDFLYRYRSVFAVGRAMDKLRYVEATTPRLLIAGNSRVDNGFDPRRLGAVLGLPSVQVFNLGLPGANVSHLRAIFARLDRAGLLGPGRVERVVLGMDEAMLQADDSLGYGVFFADAGELLSEGKLAPALASSIRLWGYAANLKELREPEKAGRFMQASFVPVEPIGGAARAFQGYRAGFGRGQFQNAAQVARQEGAAIAPPDAAVLRSLWQLLDLLAQRGVKVAVVLPPLLERDVLYARADLPQARPYVAVARELARRGVPVLALDGGAPRDRAEFINAGHLNDRGAQRYSALLAGRLSAIWTFPGGARP